MRRMWATIGIVAAALVGVYACTANPPGQQHQAQTLSNARKTAFISEAHQAATNMVESGQQIFRFDTFGDEAFWSGKLGLQQSVAKLSPNAALGLGLKVDSDALPPEVVNALQAGQVNLDDPAVTATLLKANAVVGVKGTFDGSGNLSQVGITCALCHSTVDDSLAPGVGRRIDGIANHDLDVGQIIASAPNLQPAVDLLRSVNPTITQDDVRGVLKSWGPGKFDAELFLDGKAMTPDGKPAATLIPNARGLAGHNLHTWTGGWGTVTYWNALVAVLEMHGIGNFFDPRFDNAQQFPVAAANKLGHVTVDPDSDQVTSKLPALHFYQLALPALKGRPRIDFDADAAERGDDLFNGKAQCGNCHKEPLWTEPGWNDHPASEMKIDSFQADRSPDHAYRTMNLAGLFQRERGLFMKPANKGRFYHDGRFATLLDVVNSYNDRFGLALTDAEKSDLVEYLKSL